MALPAKTVQGIRYIEVPATSDQGPTFLLLHGLGNSLDFWTVVIPELSGHGRIVAIDMPGFGLSPRPPGRFGIESVADAIIAFIREMQIQNCIVVAHSLGAIVATRLAALAPDTVSRIVMVDGALVRAAAVLRSVWRALSQPRLTIAVGAQFALGLFRIRRPIIRLLVRSKTMRRLTLWPFVKSPADINVDWLARALVHTGGGAVLLTLLRARSIDYSALISSLTVPIDIVWGDSDRLMNEQDVETVRTLATVDRCLRISNCGHWPLLESPQVLAQFILDTPAGGSRPENVLPAAPERRSADGETNALT